jgi:4-diphosphocytidyl-2-C-methyl-D-erythritol kinase
VTTTAAAPIREFAPAKINLFLHLTGRSADGYHLLSSLMVFADIGDELTVTPANRFSLTIDGPFASGLPTDNTNLVTRAAERLATLLGIAPHAALRLTKNLPVASGIGGGSADAAAALRALVKVWGRNPEADALAKLALGLGADVPVCLRSQAMNVSGIGEILDLSPKLPPAWLVLVNPGVAVATKDVFAARKGSFSQPAPLDRAPRDAAELAKMLAGRHNDLEAPAIAIAPMIDTVLDTLRTISGCLLARMSGSGATCFGLFAEASAAVTAAQKIRQTQSAWWSVAAPLRP